TGGGVLKYGSGGAKYCIVPDGTSCTVITNSPVSLVHGPSFFADVQNGGGALVVDSTGINYISGFANALTIGRRNVSGSTGFTNMIIPGFYSGVQNGQGVLFYGNGIEYCGYLNALNPAGVLCQHLNSTTSTTYMIPNLISNVQNGQGLLFYKKDGLVYCGLLNGVNPSGAVCKTISSVNYENYIEPSFVWGVQNGGGLLFYGANGAEYCGLLNGAANGSAYCKSLIIDNVTTVNTGSNGALLLVTPSKTWTCSNFNGLNPNAATCS
ncbi:MAG: hypothetical protein WCW13_06740, partial [archaeon]